MSNVRRPRLQWVDDLYRDLAYGLRTLLRTRGFTAVASNDGRLSREQQEKERRGTDFSPSPVAFKSGCRPSMRGRSRPNMWARY